MWTAQDRAWAVALVEVERDTCGGCGQPRSESTAAENEYAYTAEPERCHACATIRRASRKFTDGASESVSDGLTFHVHHD